MKRSRTIALTFSLTLCVIALFAFLLLTGDPALAQAATHYVAPGGDCGSASPCYAVIQDAVDAADDGDTVKVAQGVYTSTDFQIVYINKAITLSGGYAISDWEHSTPRTRPAVVDGEGAPRRRGIYIDGGNLMTITVAGMTIRRGYAQRSNGGGIFIRDGTVVLEDSQVLDSIATGAWPEGLGGGVYVLDGTVTLRDVLIQGNSTQSPGDTTTATGGGGLYAAGGTVTLTESIVQRNSTDRNGGGIHIMNPARAAIGNSVIQDNFSTGGSGGGMYLFDNTNVTSCTIVRNEASYWGGGVYIMGGPVVVSNSVMQDNSAEKGGGVNVSSYGIVLFEKNSILDNTVSQDGGGMHIGEGSAFVAVSRADRSDTASSEGSVLKDNVVQGNTADGYGGGIFFAEAAGYAVPLIMVGNTIIGNSAGTSGGGIAMAGLVDIPRVSASNDIVARNISPWDGVYVSGGNLTVRHWTVADNGPYALTTNGSPNVDMENTIVSGHSTGGLWGVGINASRTLFFESGIPCGGGASCTNSLFGDPLFVNPGIGDFHLGHGSAATDVAVDAGVNYDKDGEPRPIGLGYDLGADEAGVLVAKLANPSRVSAGASITYTLLVTNCSNIGLSATISDVLPPPVTPGDILFWAPPPILPGNAWTATIAVTLEKDYVGHLVNILQVSTEEGAKGKYELRTFVYDSCAFLPLVLRSASE